MSGFGGGFDNNETPSSDNKPRRNYDEQTLIPCTIKMVNNALGDPSGGGDLSLKDGRPLHMVKLVAAVRTCEERSTNFFIDIEDGTGFTQVKVWVNDGDECSAISKFRSEAGHEHQYIRIIGQIRDFDGNRQIVANDVRCVSSGDELTYHFLEVAHSYEKSLKLASEANIGMAMGSGGMGIGIGNMANQPQGGGGGGMGMMQGGGLGGGSALNDAVLNVIKTLGANADAGVHVDAITAQVTQQGYNAGDIKNAINNLSNEGHIYSTVDENNYQYAE